MMRQFMLAMMKITLVFLLCGVVLALGNITPLPDGLRIHQSDTLRVQAGVWTVLIHVDMGNEDLEEQKSAVRTNAHKLLSFITQDPSYAGRDLSYAGREMVHFRRRRDLETRLTLIVNDHPDRWEVGRRTKRGLVDVGGRLLRWAFGVATTSDVRKLRDYVQAAIVQGRDITHRQKEMVTIVDQLAASQNITRNVLNAVVTRVNDFERTSRSQWQRMEEVARFAHEDELTNTFERYYGELRYREQYLNGLRADLEMGQLTESIFPPSLLDGLRQQVDQVGFRTLDNVWYYQNCDIKLLFLDDTSYTFRVEIPFVTHEAFLRYKLEAFPVPIAEKSATIRVPSDVALHTTDGYLFTPEQCMGAAPAVCARPFKTNNLYQCVRGILASNPADRNKCALTVVDFEPRAFHVEKGGVVISTRNDSFTLACNGKPTEYGKLREGTYLIRIDMGCTFSTSIFEIKGSLDKFLEANLTIAELELPPIQFDTDFDFKTQPTRPPLQTVPFEDLYLIRHELHDLRDKLDTTDEPDPFHVNYAPHVSWGTAGLVVLIVVLVLAVGWVVFRKKSTIKYLLGYGPKQNVAVQKKSDKDEVIIVKVDDDEVDGGAPGTTGGQPGTV